MAVLVVMFTWHNMQAMQVCCDSAWLVILGSDFATTVTSAAQQRAYILSMGPVELPR
jgi:hypothetical protein